MLVLANGIGHVGWMDILATPLALVIVVGPQASGKSTLATALSAELRQRGEGVALVQLDQIAAMALPTLPSWEAAHLVFEVTAGLWARTQLTCVIAEGSGSDDEVSRLRRQAPPDAVVVTVATTAPFEAAFARAQADSSRGISREYDFLLKVYQHWADELLRIDPDVAIDTSLLTIEEGIRRVSAAIRRARSGRVGGSPRPR
jgi:energy-coupling factor transporter ATP-binding protein EcfA2